MSFGRRICTFWICRRKKQNKSKQQVELSTANGCSEALFHLDSTGKREACEKRDGDKSRYLGKGVTEAVAAVKTTVAGPDGKERNGAERTR